MSVTALNERATIGANNPPGPLDSARTALTDLSAFLAEHPVIETEEQARQAKLFIDRTRATLGEIEDARTAQVKPLNDTVAQINSAFKATSEPLRRVYDELRARLTWFARVEEERRLREAAEARRIAELAEMETRLAEQRERDAKDSAAQGELGVDIGTAAVEADRAFGEASQLARTATRAERDVNVRIGGGFSGRALGMRSQEILTITDTVAAIKEMGTTPHITEAILTSARAYRKITGTLPAGISSTHERKI